MGGNLAATVHSRIAGEADVNDMIGCGGMLGGWVTLCHIGVVWLLPALAVSIGATVLAERLTLRRAIGRPKDDLPPTRAFAMQIAGAVTDYPAPLHPVQYDVIH
jgi:hypothetical protein